MSVAMSSYIAGGRLSMETFMAPHGDDLHSIEEHNTSQRLWHLPSC